MPGPWRGCKLENTGPGYVLVIITPAASEDELEEEGWGRKAGAARAAEPTWVQPKERVPAFIQEATGHYCPAPRSWLPAGALRSEALGLAAPSRLSLHDPLLSDPVGAGHPLQQGLSIPMPSLSPCPEPRTG